MKHERRDRMYTAQDDWGATTGVGWTERGRLASCNPTLSCVQLSSHHADNGQG